MKIWFMGWMAIYLTHAVLANRMREMPNAQNSSALLAAVQFPLVIMAYYYGLIYDAINRDLLNFPVFVAGLVLGHLLFGLSLLAIHQNLSDTVAHLLDVRGFWRFLKKNPDILFRFIGVAVAEEMIYRVAAQNILLDWTESPWLAILLVAAAFSIVHWHFFRNPPVQSLEFVIFAVLLGTLYYATGSLLFVIMIHTLRNLNIVYVEYLVKEEELGDAEKAQEAMDELYRHRKIKAV